MVGFVSSLDREKGVGRSSERMNVNDREKEMVKGKI